MPLKVEKISKRYNNDWVLRDVGFEASDGEIFGVFGANGSGKSVLLRIISGHEKPNGGIVGSAHPISVFEMPRRSRLGALFGSGKGDGDYRTRAARIREFVDAANGVLLLDEPFDGLDAPVRRESVTHLRRAARDRGLTVLVATHDADLVFEACDRAVILFAKDAIQTGTPRELYDAPDSVAAALALGHVNLIEARRMSKSSSEIPEFHTIAGGHRLFTQKTEKRLLGAINQNVFLAIRPEHVSISFGASFPEDNLLRATVTEVSYRGSTTLVSLDAEGLALEARVLRLVGLDIGDQCMVGLPPDRIMVLSS
jgi:putative spermidine/putrescine transport system ATP-binding protein